MKWTRVVVIASAALLSIFPIRAFAQVPSCAHGQDETAAERARRSAAVAAVRAINDAEQDAASTAKQFRPLANLSVDLSGIASWDQQFTTDGKSYSFVLTDKTDPCRFALISSQNGVILQGYPIDFDVQPMRQRGR